MGLPASAGPAKAMAFRRPVSRQIDTDWVPSLETETLQTESPEYVPRSLEGPPPGLSDELAAAFRQLPLRNSLPQGEPTFDASLQSGRHRLHLAAAVLSYCVNATAVFVPRMG